MKTMFNKRKYLDLLLTMPVETIQKSMRDPSPAMLKRPVTIALHNIAIRRKVGSDDARKKRANPQVVGGSP